MSGQRPTDVSGSPADAGAARDGNGHGRNGGDVARRMARDDLAADRRPARTHTQPAGATASADAVEQVRRSITDIKHDVRMLKVVLDKQSIAIDRIAATLEDLAGSEEE